MSNSMMPKRPVFYVRPKPSDYLLVGIAIRKFLQDDNERAYQALGHLDTIDHDKVILRVVELSPKLNLSRTTLLEMIDKINNPYLRGVALASRLRLVEKITPEWQILCQRADVFLRTGYKGTHSNLESEKADDKINAFKYAIYHMLFVLLKSAYIDTVKPYLESIDLRYLPFLVLAILEASQFFAQTELTKTLRLMTEIRGVFEKLDPESRLELLPTYVTILNPLDPESAERTFQQLYVEAQSDDLLEIGLRLGYLSAVTNLADLDLWWRKSKKEHKPIGLSSTFLEKQKFLQLMPIIAEIPNAEIRDTLYSALNDLIAELNELHNPPADRKIDENLLFGSDSESDNEVENKPSESQMLSLEDLEAILIDNFYEPVSSNDFDLFEDNEFFAETKSFRSFGDNSDMFGDEDDFLSFDDDLSFSRDDAFGDEDDFLSFDDENTDVNAQKEQKREANYQKKRQRILKEMPSIARLTEIIRYDELIHYYLLQLSIKVIPFRNTLAILVQLAELGSYFKKRDHRILKKYASLLAKDWASQGNFQAAISASILAGHNSTVWQAIAQIAVENAQIEILIQSIENHRARQVGAKQYLALVDLLYQADDPHINMVWGKFLRFLENIANPVVVQQCLAKLRLLFFLQHHTVLWLGFLEPTQASEIVSTCLDSHQSILEDHSIMALNAFQQRFFDEQLQRQKRRSTAFLFGEVFNYSELEGFL